MCANYHPVTRADRLLAFFGATRNRDDAPTDVYPTQLAPFIRLAEDGSGNLRCDDAFFGLLPHFATELAYGRRTYNARSETVAKLASFRDAWKRGQRCVIPAECIFEPRYNEQGKAERWAIAQPGDVPLAIAGIYTHWRSPEGQRHYSFAMLTVNADEHPVMKQFHAPGEEKRMVVVLDPKEMGAWLSCPVAEAAQYFRMWNGPLVCQVAPRPPRAPAASSVRTSRVVEAAKPVAPDDLGSQGSLL